MAGKIQNEDVKSVAELTGSGGAASQLPNDTKVWVSALAINKTLSQAIIDGDIGTSTPPVYTISSSSGAFSSTSTSPVDVTNLSVGITTSGRPVIILLQSDGTSNDSYIGANGDGVANNVSGHFYIYRDATLIAQQQVDLVVGASTVIQPILIPSSSLQCFDTPAAGTYTYKVQANVSGGAGSPTVNVNYSILVAYEL